jgi:hypothetical protein
VKSLPTSKPLKSDPISKILQDKKLTIQEKVNTLLDKRQEGKAFKDTGERVAGSKKEKAVIQAVIEYGDKDIMENLMGELGTDAVLEQLNKQKILEEVEKPTAEGEIAKGTPALVANYKVNVLNKIAKTPNVMEKRGRYSNYSIIDSDLINKFIIEYPNLLKQFVADLNAISTIEEAEAFADKYRSNLGEIKNEVNESDRQELETRIERLELSIALNKERGLYVSGAEEDIKDYQNQIANGRVRVISNAVFGKNFGSLISTLNVSGYSGKFIKGNYQGAFSQYKDAQEKLSFIENNGVLERKSDWNDKVDYATMSFSTEDGTVGGKRFDTPEEAKAYFTNKLAEKNLKREDVFKAEKAKAEETIKDLTTNYEKFLQVKEVGKTKQIKDAEKKVESIKKAITKYQEVVDTSKDKSDVERYKKYIESSAKDLVDAELYLSRLTGKEEALTHGNFQQIEEYDVKDARFKKDFVKAENLMKVFGFKSAQFGNYMDDASSKEHLVQVMASMEDMSKMLNVDFAKIANEMGLSIAFGARGGGGANAHFEPTHKIINMTKGRGDGSFGHEFLHALDFILGKSTYRGKWSGKGSGRYYNSVSGDYQSLQITNAFLRGVDVATSKD